MLSGKVERGHTVSENRESREKGTCKTGGQRTVKPAVGLRIMWMTRVKSAKVQREYRAEDNLSSKDKDNNDHG